MNNKPNLNAARATYGKPNYERGTQYLPWPGKPLDHTHTLYQMKICVIQRG